MLDVPTLDPVLVVAAQFGLDKCEISDGLPLAPANEIATLRLALRDHLTGFVALSESAGEIKLSDIGKAALRNQWHDELLASVVLESFAIRTAEILNDAGARWLLTKGPALAHLDYPDPSMRTFGDIDIVIHPRDWDLACRVLTDHDYLREVPAISTMYDNRFGKGATFVSGPLELDLHRRFAIGRFGVTSYMEEVFENTTTVQFGGVRVPTMSPENRLLHACFHASLGGFRYLRAFRDVAQLTLVSGADCEVTMQTARRWRAEAVVVTALTESWSRLQLVEHQFVTSVGRQYVSRGDRRSLQIFRNDAGFTSEALTSIHRLAPWQSAAYILTLGRHRLRRRR